jgi:hypothetical protein
LLKNILANKSAHEYKLSESFRQPGRAQDDMFSKALKKALKSHAVQDRLHELLSDDVKYCMNQYPMDKNQYQILMSKPSFEAVGDILYKGGFLHWFYLGKLEKDLDAIFERANDDRSLFLSLAEEKEIKIRLLKNNTFMYEVKGVEGAFRFKENRLPQKFRNAMLKAKPQSKIYKLQEEQYRYVFDRLRDSLKDALTLKDVFAQLSEWQIHFFDENKQPINEKNGSQVLFGKCLFVDQSSSNPVFIPGKSLSKSMSGKTLGDIVKGSMSTGFVQTHFPTSNYPAVLNFAPVHSHYTPEDDFMKRKRRKKSIGDIEIKS